MLRKFLNTNCQSHQELGHGQSKKVNLNNFSFVKNELGAIRIIATVNTSLVLNIQIDPATHESFWEKKIFRNAKQFRASEERMRMHNVITETRWWIQYPLSVLMRMFSLLMFLWMHLKSLFFYVFMTVSVLSRIFPFFWKFADFDEEHRLSIHFCLSNWALYFVRFSFFFLLFSSFWIPYTKSVNKMWTNRELRYKTFTHGTFGPK